MDITPQLLKDIRLTTSRRGGYDQDEVDELIERVGAAIVQLQGRLRDAMERADNAEAHALAGNTRSESEDTLRRTLVLAQRTADAAVSEANAEAARTTTEANDHAARTISEANERASRLLSDAEAQANVLRTETDSELRRMAEDSRAPLLSEIRELERSRSFLRDDVELLERHLQAQRDRLRSHVSELSRIIEEPSTLRLEPVPATSGVDVSAVLAPREQPRPDIVVAPLAPPASFATAVEATEDEGTPTISYEPLVEPRAYAAPPTSLGQPTWSDDDADDADDEPFADGAPAAAGALEHQDPRGGDQFLDQLRRAVDDEVGIDDGAMSDFFDAEVDDNPRSRFGRRR